MHTRMKTLMAALCSLLTLTAVAAEPVPLFSGSDSYVDLGKPDALQIPSKAPFTVEGWMLFDTLKSRDMLYCKSAGRTSAYSYMLGFADGKLAAYNTAWRGQFEVTRELGRWYHVAFSFDGSTMSFYLDGELLGTAAFSFNNNVAHTAKIGGYLSSADINGMKSDVRLWDHGRSQAEIQGAMSNRLTGVESGLIGYWPMNEGTGAIVYDRSANDSNGDVINASWTSTDILSIGPSSAGFDFFLPFSLADIETGQTGFTNSNEVDVAVFPIPDGYDRYQINQSATRDGIDTNGWTATNTPPDRLAFTPPVGDDDIFLYAWFTNSTESVTPRRGQGDIRYTQVPPVPVARVNRQRELIPGQPVVIYSEEIDNGSSGGVTGEAAIPIHTMWLNWLDGPDSDATPDEPVVTVAELGTYEVELVVQNAAGNVATSMVCEVEVIDYSGDPFVWTGAFDNDWHNLLNWNLNATPHEGSEVIIGDGASVVLSTSTPVLQSISLGGSLTFSGWDTVLNAETVVIEGKISHLPQSATTTNALGGWDPDNRVWIVCDSMELKAGGQIDVDDMGYAGRMIIRGSGPGGGEVGPHGGGGGGHGGLGGDGWNGVGGSVVYGDLDTPFEPGSAGGGCLSDGGTAGFNGGGAVRIEAATTVTINGTITANAISGAGRPGRGSGGSIFITCTTFAGTNGTIAANGGDTTGIGGGGGGGRIAIQYDLFAQQSVPSPTVTFSARHGYSSRNNSVEHGTLYLPDSTILDPDWIPHSGILHIPDFNTWSVDNLTVIDGQFTIYGTMDITVADTMTVTGPDALFVLRSGRIFCRDLLVTDQASFHLGYRTTTPDDPSQSISEIWCDGNLTLTDGATMQVIPVQKSFLPPDRNYGSRVDIGGDLVIGPDSWIFPYSDEFDGSSVLFRSSNLTIAEGGGFNADGLGYRRGIHGNTVNGFGPGGGIAAVASGSGGGYGGHGGRGSGSASRGMTNGCPLHLTGPGSGGSARTGGTSQGGNGGGLIWLDIDGVAEVHGTLTANGNTTSGDHGGGSGGGIYLNCREFIGGPTAALHADGGDAGNANGGGGGGGRIAVWHGAPFSADLPGSRFVIKETPPNTFHGTISVLNGFGYASETEYSEPGTIRFIEVLHPQGTMMIIR